jgi:hypothetical protein
MGDERGSNPLGGLEGLLGSGAQPGGAGGMDFSQATDAVSQLLANPDAMAAVKSSIADGSSLREALGVAAQKVPAATGPIDTLLANPGVLEELSASMSGLIGGTPPDGGAAEVDHADAGSILGKLFGGDR